MRIRFPISAPNRNSLTWSPKRCIYCACQDLSLSSEAFKQTQHAQVYRPTAILSSEPKALRIYKTEDYKLVTLLDSSTQRICSLAVRNSIALASSISYQVYVQREYMVLAAVVTRGQPLTVFLPSYYAA